MSPRARGSIKSAAPPRKATPAANEQKRKLKGVTKRPKKDKIVGKFSVERFKNSDKDIEYYTAFKSYRNFEAFFRSLEAYIERICITDVTYGVNNLVSSVRLLHNDSASKVLHFLGVYLIFLLLHIVFLISASI